MNDLSHWTDRVALVTGASSGIGEAIAKRLVDEGMRVVGCARRVERLNRLRERLGARFVPYEVDLRDDAAVHGMFAVIERRVGPVDVLVNNAGLGRDASLISGDPRLWREMIDTNVVALALCSQLALRRMRAGPDDGMIIHIGSMAGHRLPPGGNGMYAATKFAVRALTEGLRQELHAAGSGVRVGAVSPGLVETEFPQRFYATEEEAAQAAHDFPILHPADVADAVAYMLSQPPHVQVHDVLLRPRRQAS